MRLVKQIFGFAFSRLFLVAVMLILQIGLMAAVVTYFSQSAFYFYVLFHIISIVVVVFIVSNNTNPFYKITWIVTILGFPVAGGLFYLFFGATRLPRKLIRKLEQTENIIRDYIPKQPEKLLDHDEPLNPSLRLLEHYICNVTGFPACRNAAAEYFALGEHMFDAMVRELMRAERYILLEYFIIKPGLVWDTIFDILKLKIKQGVNVYLMYDDLGSINTLPKGYDRRIRAAGIRLCVFNPFRPRLSPMLNYRDHRKLMVIDGKTALCGGINLADEYINRIERFGHWRDTGVMLRGEAAWQFALLFFQQWQFGAQSNLEPAHFRPAPQGLAGNSYGAENDNQDYTGLVQIFGDSPLDSINVTESAYLSIISRATKYVYITTPYLVIDYEMEQALCAAAQSGVDVRIITPYRYDKWYVHVLTRSHYRKLIWSGVKIYEYTPGFIHSKMFVSDDTVCMVGTCNMDFRSFYLHFECSVVFYNGGIVNTVKSDILDCQKQSHEISLGEASHLPTHLRMLRAVLKLFAPLM